jgi:hypothetical protein
VSSDGYYLCFSAGGFPLALDGNHVDAIDPKQEASAELPTLSLGHHFGIEEDDCRHRVVLDHGGGRAQLWVGNGVQVRNFGADAELAVPRWLGALEQRIGLKGVLLEESAMHLVLDPAALVRAAKAAH